MSIVKRRLVVPAPPDRGTALVAAIVLVAFLTSVGVVLAFVASQYPAISRNAEGAVAAGAAAEEALVAAAHGLADIDDWTTLLEGSRRPATLLPVIGAGPRWASGLMPTWLSLGAVRTCGKPAGCSPAARTAISRARPWGANNGAFVCLGVWRVEPVGRRAPFDVGVWVADDPAETDGNPYVDGGGWPDRTEDPPSGWGAVLLRVEAFGPQGDHAALEATVIRPAPGLPLRLARRGPGP